MTDYPENIPPASPRGGDTQAFDHRRTVIEAFCQECVWARSIRTHFTALFEFNEDRLELLSEVANTFFHDLNLILIDYILLQQCKLTDPASAGKDKSNLTTNYILSLQWTDETKQTLLAKNNEMMAFRGKISDARRKLIAHLDLKIRLQSHGLGAFSEAEEANFWSSLQQFVDAAHFEAVGSHYEISATMPDGDFVFGEPNLLLRRANRIRYKDA